MKKIDVVLLAVLDDGKEQKEPGETVSMDEEQARQLAALGMVQLPQEEAPSKASKKAGKKNGAKTPPPPPPGNGDQDPDNSGTGDGNGGQGQNGEDS